ncbi:MAG: hypothetical protein ACI9S8_000830 [Chlamydiales bacterium]|jgi:hypothetical protein
MKINRKFNLMIVRISMSLTPLYQFPHINPQLLIVTDSHLRYEESLPFEPVELPDNHPLLRRTVRCLDCSNTIFQGDDCDRCFTRVVVENKASLTPEVLSNKVRDLRLRNRERAYLTPILRILIPNVCSFHLEKNIEKYF